MGRCRPVPLRFNVAGSVGYAVVDQDQFLLRFTRHFMDVIFLIPDLLSNRIPVVHAPPTVAAACMVHRTNGWVAPLDVHRSTRRLPV